LTLGLIALSLLRRQGEINLRMKVRYAHTGRDAPAVAEETRIAQRRIAALAPTRPIACQLAQQPEMETN
jgi:hypothetical protein